MLIYRVRSGWTGKTMALAHDARTSWRLVRKHDLEPNIFSAGPSTQSIIKYYSLKFLPLPFCLKKNPCAMFQLNIVVIQEKGNKKYTGKTKKSILRIQSVTCCVDCFFVVSLKNWLKVFLQAKIPKKCF